MRWRAVPAAGGGALPASGGASLSGTAATGAPLANATITIKDRNGLQATGTTGADGKYSIPVSTLTAPFLLKVTATSTPDLYSVAFQTGIVNLTPLTDLVLKNSYRARGLEVATEFTNLTSISIIPTTDEITLLVNQIKNLVAQWLVVNGVDPDGYNFMTTAFNANGAGMDAVLDQSILSDNGTTITLTVTGGGTTQISLVTANPSTSQVNTATTVTSAAGTSTSASSTLVPSTTNALTALAGVNATWTQFKNIVNARGNALTNTDMAPLIAPGAQWEGLNTTQFAGQLAHLRGTTILTLFASGIVSYDDVNNVIDVEVLVTESTPTGPAEDKITMLFKQVGSSWLLFGNQPLGVLDFAVESRTDNNSTTGGAVSQKLVSVDVRVPRGLIDLVAGVRITCPTLTTLFNDTPVPSAGTRIDRYHPTTNATDDFPVTSDVFFVAASNLANYPPPGTVCNITMTPVGASPVSYPVVTGGTTTETVTVTTTAVGYAIGDVANRIVTMNWTLPTSFQVTSIQTGANAKNASNVNTFVDGPELGPTATSSSVTVPATVGGSATNQTTINLSINGPNGERIQYLYSYN